MYKDVSCVHAWNMWEKEYKLRYLKVVVLCIIIECKYKIQQMQQYADIYSLQNYSTFFRCHNTHHQDYQKLYPQSPVQVILLVPLLPSYVVWSELVQINIYRNPSDVYKTQIHHYTVYLDRRYMGCVSWMRLCFILCCERRFYTHSRRYKQQGAYNRRVLLLYGGTVTAVWAVLFNICILEF